MDAAQADPLAMLRRDGPWVPPRGAAQAAAHFGTYHGSASHAWLAGGGLPASAFGASPLTGGLGPWAGSLAGSTSPAAAWLPQEYGCALGTATPMLMRPPPPPVAPLTSALPHAQLLQLEQLEQRRRLEQQFAAAVAAAARAAPAPPTYAPSVPPPTLLATSSSAPRQPMHSPRDMAMEVPTEDSDAVCDDVPSDRVYCRVLCLMHRQVLGKVPRPSGFPIRTVLANEVDGPSDVPLSPEKVQRPAAAARRIDGARSGRGGGRGRGAGAVGAMASRAPTSALPSPSTPQQAKWAQTGQDSKGPAGADPGAFLLRLVKVRTTGRLATIAYMRRKSATHKCRMRAKVLLCFANYRRLQRALLVLLPPMARQLARASCGNFRLLRAARATSMAPPKAQRS